MDGGSAQYNPRTVEEVFRDFKGRRAGLIKALTTGECLSIFLGFRKIPFFFCFWGVFSVCFLFFIFGLNVADVEDFYQQCDPGEDFQPWFSFLLVSCVVLFVKFSFFGFLGVSSCVLCCVVSFLQPWFSFSSWFSFLCIFLGFLELFFVFYVFFVRTCLVRD